VESCLKLIVSNTWARNTLANAALWGNELSKPWNLNVEESCTSWNGNILVGTYKSEDPVSISRDRT
jgi:hypothetical protein